MTPFSADASTVGPTPRKGRFFLAEPLRFGESDRRWIRALEHVYYSVKSTINNIPIQKKGRLLSFPFFFD